jgi:hypothetical protein
MKFYTYYKTFGIKIKIMFFVLLHRGAHDFLATSNAMLKIYVTLSRFRSFITTKKKIFGTVHL